MKPYLLRAAMLVLAAVVGAGAVWFLKPGAPPATPTQNPATEPSQPMPTHPALPRMEVIAQYGGPLADTLIQRLRDPIDGTTCYLYLPIAVHHTAPNVETGYVEYGSNGVGSISCFPASRRN